jgi:hypothetical protein
MLEVVAGVHDHRQTLAQQLRQAIRQLGATHPAREG